MTRIIFIVMAALMTSMAHAVPDPVTQLNQMSAQAVYLQYQNEINPVIKNTNVPTFFDIRDGQTWGGGAPTSPSKFYVLNLIATNGNYLGTVHIAVYGGNNPTVQVSYMPIQPPSGASVGNNF